MNKKKEEKEWVEEEPVKQVLTKELEIELVNSYWDKVAETLKASNELHEMFQESNIDKESMTNALYGDWLFNQLFGRLIYNCKILSNKKLEEFLVKWCSVML